MDVGANAHIGPLCASIDQGPRVDEGIDPYKNVIGAVDIFNHSRSEYNNFAFCIYSVYIILDFMGTMGSKGVRI